MYTSTCSNANVLYMRPFSKMLKREQTHKKKGAAPQTKYCRKRLSLSRDIKAGVARAHVQKNAELMQWHITRESPTSQHTKFRRNRTSGS